MDDELYNEHPLRWPVGQPRAMERRSARFRMAYYDIIEELVRDLRLLGAVTATISSNLELRADGAPYSRQLAGGSQPPSDPGVALYFVLQGKSYSMACDRWKTVEGNLRAISMTLAAIRGIERWGSSQFVKQAFAGFRHALPNGWQTILGNVKTAEEAKERYRELAQVCHPDRGGSDAKMQELNRAYEQARQELRG